jgi:hypothetical protein
MFEYIAWRYQVRNSYSSLPWHKRASASDRDDLSGANELLLKHVEALNLHLHPVSTSTWDNEDFQASEQRSAEARVARLRDEAPDIFKRLLSAPAIDHAAATLFADYCHDSYAGFRPFDQVKIFGWDPVPGSWEPEGYFRWRRRYEGDSVQLVRIESPKQPGQTPRTKVAVRQRPGSDQPEATAA